MAAPDRAYAAACCGVGAFGGGAAADQAHRLGHAGVVGRAGDGDPQWQAFELEKSLRQLRAKLAERERNLDGFLVRLAERESEIAETVALLLARQRLFEASRRQPGRAEGGTSAPISSEERAALQLLTEELERQETSLREDRAALKEREAFLEESENRLFEKVPSQQETELEQREDDLRQREARLRQRKAAQDPAAAKAKRPFDEFNE